MTVRSCARRGGFTLVELIVVMVLVGVIAGVLVLQVRPAMQSYLAIRQRANLTSQADAALRRIVAEVHAAVPNSLRYTQDANNQCIEFVPTVDGGRFRIDYDYANQANPYGTPVLGGTPTSQFGVLTTLASAGGQKVARAGDFVVIGNVNRDDVYAGLAGAAGGVNVGQIGTIADSATAADQTVARHLITLAGPIAFPAGYEGGRFVVVAAGERAVTYTCDVKSGAVWRVTGYLPAAAQANACPTGTAKLVGKVSDCGFTYRENEGATQQSGYLQLRLGLTDGGETARLTLGTHVENVP
jgi:MSHA biogenesis protein MshO